VGAVPGMAMGLNGGNNAVNVGAGAEDEDVDIMDRETVKLLANTLVNATALKRAREKQAHKAEALPGNPSMGEHRHQSSHNLLSTRGRTSSSSSINSCMDTI
jgi:hypothetical protein